MASTPSSPAGAPGEDQGVSRVAVAAKLSSRKLGDPGKAGWAPVMTEKDPRKAPSVPGMPGEARNSCGVSVSLGGRVVPVHQHRARGKALGWLGYWWQKALGPWGEEATEGGKATVL